MSKRVYVVFGLVMALTLIFAGSAFARGPVAQQEANAAYVDEDGDGVCDLTGEPLAQGAYGRQGGDSGMGAGRSDEWSTVSMLSIVAQETGLTEDEITARLQSGETMSEIIEASGSSVEAVIDAYVAARQAELDQWLAEGRITQYQYDTMVARIAEQAEEHLNSDEWCNGSAGNGQGDGAPIGRGGRRGGGEAPGRNVPQSDGTPQMNQGRSW